jgi:hypothetical protein
MTTTPDHDFTKPLATDALASGTMLRESAARHSIPDPDLEPVVEQSDLELIAADLKAELKADSIVLPVETRPGYSLRFDTDIPYEALEKWRKAAKDRKASNGVDVSRLAALVIANKCIAILKDGRVLTDGDGDPLTFGSDEIRAMYDVLRAADAVKIMIGRDARMQAISDAVIGAAGWGDEVSEVDPTAAD